MAYTLATEKLLIMNKKIDFWIPIGISAIEPLYNIATIYKIVKEAYKMRLDSTTKFALNS